MSGKADNPRRESRRRAILDAAESLFLEQGFERVSLSAIVQRSGGSLATIYALFGNKHGLLHAVVNQAGEEELEDFSLLSDEDGSPAAILLEFGLRFHRFATAPRMLALTRLVIAESQNDPEFGIQLVQDMHLRAISRIAEVLTAWTAAGKAFVDRPEEAADLFLASVLCDAPVRNILGVPSQPIDAQTIEWRLRPFFTHFRIAS